MSAEQAPFSMKSASPPPSLLARAREAVCIAILCSTMLLTQSALSQTIFPLSYISRSFHVESDPGLQSWFTAAFSLTVGTFVLPSGRLGDMFGHRLMVQVGFAWFAVWQLAAGLIGQYTESVVGFCFVRGLIGIGPSILLPNAIAILARLNPPGSLRKMVSFCLFAATAPNGSILGGAFGVLLARNPDLGWYWSFYIFAIALVLLFAMTWFFIPSDKAVRRRVASWSTDEQQPIDGARKRSFDILGTVVGVSGLVLFNFAFNQAIVVGWQIVYVYVLLIVGLLFMVAFVLIEARVEDPLVPLEVFNSKTTLVLACVAFGWSSFGIWFFYSVRFLQEIRLDSALSVVAQFAPAGVSGIIAAFVSVFLLKKIHPGFVMLGAMVAFCTGNILIGTMPVRQVFWIQMFLSSVITPFGMDMSFPSASIIISDALPPEKQGMAGSLVNTIVNYSIAFGLGLAGTVELQVNEGNTDIERGFRGALYMGIGLAGCGIICAAVLLLTDAFQTRRKQRAKAVGKEAEGTIVKSGAQQEQA